MGLAGEAVLVPRRGRRLSLSWPHRSGGRRTVQGQHRSAGSAPPTYPTRLSRPSHEEVAARVRRTPVKRAYQSIVVMASAAPTVSRPLRLPPVTGDQRLFALATLLGIGTAVVWVLVLGHAVRGDGAISLPWWAAFAACYAAGLLTIDVGVRPRFTVSLAEVPLVLGLFFVDPLVLAGCYSVGVLLASWTRRGVLPARDYGNLLLDTAFVTVAVLVFAAVHPDPADALSPRSILAVIAAMGAAGCVVAPLLLLASVALYRDRLLPADALHEFTTQVAGTIVSTSLAIIVLALAASRPWVCVALAPPLLLIAALHATASRARGRADSAAFLVRAGEILQRSAPVGDRAGALLDALAETFDAARVELVLTGEQRTAALHFSRTRDDRLRSDQSDLSPGELEALRSLDDRRVTTVRADATDTPLWRLAGERGVQSCAACTLPGSERAQGLLVLDRAPKSRRQTELLLATASLIGAAAVRGELITRDRRRGAGDATAERQGETRLLRGRPGFAEAVTAALGRLAATRRPLALLVIDLDGFVGIRGTYGDTVADAVLTTVASRLRRHLRRYDVMAHLGSERLALLLDTLRHRSDAAVVAQRILKTLQQPIELGGDSITLSGSVGIAAVDDYGTIPSADELIHRADMAVYLAKRQAGTRYVVFDSAARQPVIATTPDPKQ